MDIEVIGHYRQNQRYRDYKTIFETCRKYGDEITIPEEIEDIYYTDNDEFPISVAMNDEIETNEFGFLFSIMEISAVDDLSDFIDIFDSIVITPSKYEVFEVIGDKEETAKIDEAVRIIRDAGIEINERSVEVAKRREKTIGDYRVRELTKLKRSNKNITIDTNDIKFDQLIIIPSKKKVKVEMKKEAKGRKIILGD